MTPTTLIQVGLDNAGLGSTADRVTRARTYLNQAAQRLYAWSIPIPGTKQRQAVQWQWAFKETTLSLSNGTRGYSLAADVLEPLAFYDTTNDTWVPMDSVTTTDRWDPDEDETGDPERVVLTGRDSSTGYWTVDVYPTPDASMTLRYRYYAQWTDRTANDDDTDLNAILPDWLQPALSAAIAEHLLREHADLEAADIHRRIKEDIIEAGVARNYRAGGELNLRLARPWPWADGRFTFRVQEGSLT